MDPRVAAVDGFTKTQHTSVPPALDPSSVKLDDGFTVCIIGASTGIGEHIAYSFAMAQATRIIIASRTLADLEIVADEARRFNPRVQIDVVECDVSKAPEVEALADYVRGHCSGRLDVLILNAGYAGPVVTKMDQGRPEWVQQAFEVNALGTYLTAHYFVPLLVQSQSKAKGFIAIGSIAGCIRRGPIANTGYTVSKFAQIRLVEYLHEQYSGTGLVSLALHPGAVMTRMASGNTPEEFMPYMTDEVDLCGAVCVYLSRQIGDLGWLSGRLISATWDMEELMAKKAKITEKDLLKFVLVTE
ncbi:11-beta-hydroxysteroid dehydrogenase-like 3 [Fonsecaea pedrosoi]|nr:11-beta-hydroxysteroid dehydrogenase-like 3 [Fonsecaea pedrosoi]